MCVYDLGDRFLADRTRVRLGQRGSEKMRIPPMGFRFHDHSSCEDGAGHFEGRVSIGQLPHWPVHVVFSHALPVFVTCATWSSCPMETAFGHLFGFFNGNVFVLLGEWVGSLVVDGRASGVERFPVLLAVYWLCVRALTSFTCTSSAPLFDCAVHEDGALGIIGVDTLTCQVDASLRHLCCSFLGVADFQNPTSCNLCNSLSDVRSVATRFVLARRRGYGPLIIRVSMVAWLGGASLDYWMAHVAVLAFNLATRTGSSCGYNFLESVLPTDLEIVCQWCASRLGSPNTPLPSRCPAIAGSRSTGVHPAPLGGPPPSCTSSPLQPSPL